MRCDEGKHRYPSHSDATKTMIYMAHAAWKRGRFEKKLAHRTYPCPFCGDWHITSQHMRKARG